MLPLAGFFIWILTLAYSEFALSVLWSRNYGNNFNTVTTKCYLSMTRTAPVAFPYAC